MTTVHVQSGLDVDERTLANDVLDGLTKPFKELAPKHFYDARGSDRIGPLEVHGVVGDLRAPPRACARVAFYDRRNEWVEMRLRASRACSVFVADLDLRVEFAAGEELRTEISAKFTRERVEADLAAAGMELDAWSADADGLFGVSSARRSP